MDNNQETSKDTSTKLIIASVGQRIGNIFIDLIALFALSLFIEYLISETDFYHDYMRLDGIKRLIWVILVVFYFTILEATTGKTLGKLVTGTKAVSEDGSKLTFGKALGRVLCRFIPFEVFSFFGSKGKPIGWHDSIPGTLVISSIRNKKTETITDNTQLERSKPIEKPTQDHKYETEPSEIQESVVINQTVEKENQANIPKSKNKVLKYSLITSGIIALIAGSIYLYSEGHIEYIINSPEELCEKGEVKYDSSDYNGAIKYYNKAIQKDPKFAKAFFLKAFAYWATGYSGLAIDEFTEAINLDVKKNYPRALLGRGILYAGDQRYYEAIKDFSEYLKQENIDSEGRRLCYMNRAESKIRLNDIRGAIQDYTTLTEINPQDEEAFVERARIKLRIKKYKESIQDCNIAISINLRNASAYNIRGLAKEYSGDYQSALQDYSWAITSNPVWADPYYNRGSLKYKMKDKDGACLDWSKAGELGEKGAYYRIQYDCK